MRASTLELLRRCDVLARCSEDEGRLTRTFLSRAMRDAHAAVRGWMEAAGMEVRVDAAGNIVGRLPAADADAPALLVGSHLDSVRNAGRYDGVLGVLLGVALAEALAGRRLPFHLDVIGFSEEEGVRFGVPFLGSRALTGTFDEALLGLRDAGGVTAGEAIRAFGLDPDEIPMAAYDPARVVGYLEAHIEQGPRLAALGAPVGVVDAVAGSSRARLAYSGAAGHAGTSPMGVRRDALTGAAEFILAVERHARRTPDLVATVGTIDARPGAVNVIPGAVTLSLDVRHREDGARRGAVVALRAEAAAIAAARGLGLDWRELMDQPAVPLDARLRRLLTEAAGDGVPVIPSGAGHDAMVLAPFTPSAMLFVRSPNGVSHTPEETVEAEDVEAALGVLLRFTTALSNLAG